MAWGCWTFASIPHVCGLVPGECLAGALYWRDLYSIAEEVGFSPPCLVTASPITIGNKELEAIVGEDPAREWQLWEAVGSPAGIPTQVLSAQATNLSIVGDCRFVSATFRLFKVPAGSRAGPAQVIYNGGIVGHERELVFDANFSFKVWGGMLGLCREELKLMKPLLSSILCDVGEKLCWRGWWVGAKGLCKPRGVQMYRRGRQMHALLCGKGRSWTSMVAFQNGLKPGAWVWSVFLQVLGQDTLRLSLSPSSGWVDGVPWETYPGPQACDHSSAPRKERWWMWMLRWLQSCGAPGLRRSS